MEGHPASKNLGVGLLMVTVWLDSEHLIAPLFTTSSVILSSNEIQNGDILVPAYPGCPGKWSLQNECHHNNEVNVTVRSGIEIGTVLCSQVWKNRKVWEGFVKCCQRTKPQSFLVLLQLPAVQLRDVFTLCPELREPLLNHIQTLTPHQVARNWDWQLLIFIRLTLNECHGHNEVSSLFLPSELCHCGFGVGNSIQSLNSSRLKWFFVRNRSTVEMYDGNLCYLFISISKCLTCNIVNIRFTIYKIMQCNSWPQKFFAEKIIISTRQIAVSYVSGLCSDLCLQRAHIPKAIMSVLEKDASEQKAVEKARRVEEERLTQQEKLYQVYHWTIHTVKILINYVQFLTNNV